MEQSLSLIEKKHKHEWREIDNLLTCECGKKKLKLIKTNKEGLFSGIKSDGSSYSVRRSRSRYFTPDEWNTLYSSLRDKNKFLFYTLIETGARIDEALNIRAKDIEPDRKKLTLFVTKSKAKKGENAEFGGKPRSFEVSSDYIKKAKKYITTNKIQENSETLLFKTTEQSVWQLLRRRLIKIGIKDYYNISLHNIRKSHGMWLKKLIPRSRGEITEGEICMRLGHDYDTFLKHYGSPSIFNYDDENKMIAILGDIYGLR